MQDSDWRRGGEISTKLIAFKIQLDGRMTLIGIFRMGGRGLFGRGKIGGMLEALYKYTSFFNYKNYLD